jgi:hypothetical protein
MIKVTYSRHYVSTIISDPVTFVTDEGHMYLCDGDERYRILVSAIRNVEVMS